MSPEQVVAAVAGAICIVGSVVAVTHRDARAAGAAFVITLLSLAVLCAGLAAPAVSVTLIVVALVAAVPLVVRVAPSAARAETVGWPVVTGAALLIAAAFVAILFVAIALGEVPVNVSLRSGDGYDVGGLLDAVAGRAAMAVGACVVLLLAAAVAARAARQAPRCSSPGTCISARPCSRSVRSPRSCGPARSAGSPASSSCSPRPR
jgi:NADH:ubiquinone oxidoreductase subunit 6 (subunit J)